MVANWLVGREIVEEEQRGKRRAGYGEKLIETLSTQITAEFGRGYSVNNLERFRNFYVTYPELMAGPIPHAPRGELTDQPLGGGCIARNAHGQRATVAEVTDPEGDWPTGEQIPHAARGESTTSLPLTRSICHAARDESPLAGSLSEILYADA